jgi:coenzyme F420 biosynthesis associated uncharacterized protein
VTDTSVDWDLARQVATKISERNNVVSSYHYATLSPDFERFTAQAEELVAETTGLVSQIGEARGRVADRPMWIDANIDSFQRLLRPLSHKLSNPDASLLKELGSKASGAEMGLLLGWMSGRVLGQYDLLIIEDEHPEDQDIVYYVGPNVLAIEKKYGFPPEEFRLWLALHECTHRAQFTGVPWLRDHFLGLVNKTLESVDPDPEMFRDAAKRIVESKKTGEDIFEDGGLPTLFTTPEQRETLNQISGMMSLLEGHGDVTMDRAGVGHVANADVFAKTFRDRRNSAKGLTRIFQKVAGFEAKLNQYQAGEKFIQEVESSGGPDLLNMAWEKPENLPNLDEIKSPHEWVKRINNQ